MKGVFFGGIETQFKKGNKPHTWRPVGSYRKTEDGYLQCKVSDTGRSIKDYVNVHHLLWRAAGREIPVGYALCFRDGDKTNLTLENLELVSRRALMLRNSIHNAGKEIAYLQQLRGAIMRHINRREGTTK